MTYVIRRTTPTKNGARYYHPSGPVRHSGDAHWFPDLTPAQEVRDTRKEPALWEIMTPREADCKDAREQLDAARRPKPSALTVALLAHVATLRGR